MKKKQEIKETEGFFKDKINDKTFANPSKKKRE
jgi:hypothetical protein